MERSLKFDGVIDWLISVRDPRETWRDHPTYLLEEIIFYVTGILIFSHAWKNGGRYLQLWIATILHGITVESLAYFVPDIDNFWHSQTTVMLLGRRMPLHIMFLYPRFIYVASVAVSKARLARWAEPFAVGLLVVLIDCVYDIMGIKLVFWTWHDTDPNVYDRFYWVPWCSFYFHATFASSFTIIFHGTRSLLTGNEKFETSSLGKEFFCTLLTGLFSMPMGILQFIPLYHPLHDNLKIHTEVCVFLIFSFYFIMIWKSDRNPVPTGRNHKGPWFDRIALTLIIHYGFYFLLAVFSKPENVRANGLHEPIGPCNETTPVYTALGQKLYKKTYLCLEDYDEQYFDFKCVSSPPKLGSDWYVACGNKFPNHAEYIFVVGGLCVFAFRIFYQLLAKSGNYPKVTKGGKVKKN